MKDWQRKQAAVRRAPNKRLAVTCAFTTYDLMAIGYAMNIDEPSQAQLRRFAEKAIDLHVADARKRYEERRIEDDIAF